jgi:hypothetical protein
VISLEIFTPVERYQTEFANGKNMKPDQMFK